MIMADIDRVKHNIVEANSFARSSQESFTFSCFNDDTMPYSFEDHELFFDMDVSVPAFPWEHAAHDIVGCDDSHSSEIQEFEFSMSFPDTGSATIAGAVSPADDLFYKGKLLPLHLPPRLRMVEHLSASAANISEDEDQLDVSSVLLSYYCRKSDAVENHEDITDLATISDESFEPPSSPKESLVSWSGGSRGLRLGSEGPWIDGRSLQDPYIFPNCYRDPALQIIEDGAIRRAAARDPSIIAWRRPSLRWKVFRQPGSRKSLKVTGIDCCSMQSGKDTGMGEQKRAISVFKFRASSSFLKSLFAVSEIGKGAQLMKESKYQVMKEESLKNSVQNAASSGGEVVGDDTKEANKIAQSEKDRLRTSKARDCLRKYMKLLRSLYVMISQKSTDQSEELLGNSRSTGHHGQIHRFFSGNLRTTSFSKRSRDNSNYEGSIDKNHSGNLKANSNDQGNLVADSNIHQGNPNRIEVENPIKGAIAHCKQSAEGGSWIRDTLPVHTSPNFPASQ